MQTGVTDRTLVLFDGRAGQERAIVWLEPAGSDALLRTEEWGDGIERNFGFDSIETAVRIGGSALATLAAALVMDRSELDATALPLEVVAAAYRGDSAASATVGAASRSSVSTSSSRCDDGPPGFRLIRHDA